MDFSNWNCSLFLVFFCGLGFTIQKLIIRSLSLAGFRFSLECICLRGLIQMFLVSFVIYYVHFTSYSNGPRLLGNNYFTIFVMFLRGLFGYIGLLFQFLAAERLPVGDCTVLVMLSPTIAAIFGRIFLGEPWLFGEFICTILAICGIVLVIQPGFIFGFETSGALNSLGVMYAIISAVASGEYVQIIIC
jgi:drug/metabolite transporter (DMT)-like permease